MRLYLLLFWTDLLVYSIIAHSGLYPNSETVKQQFATSILLKYMFRTPPLPKQEIPPPPPLLSVAESLFTREAPRALSSLIFGHIVRTFCLTAIIDFFFFFSRCEGYR